MEIENVFSKTLLSSHRCICFHLFSIVELRLINLWRLSVHPKAVEISGQLKIRVFKKSLRYKDVISGALYEQYKGKLIRLIQL